MDLSKLSPDVVESMMNEAYKAAEKQLELRKRDLARNVELYGANKEIYECREPEVGISGPAGTGKSRAWMEKVNRLMWEYPMARALFVRKTRASMSETVLATFENWVLGMDNPMVGTLKREYRKKYRYVNGSEIIIAGIDTPSRILSSDYDIIVMFEAIEMGIEDYELLNTRLRNGRIPYQQLGFDTNPGAPTHWIKQRANAGICKLVFGTHEDNPRLYDHKAHSFRAEGVAYIAKLDNLTGVRKQRMRFGLWVQAEGLVYDLFDERIHVIDKFEIPPDWRRIRVIDFGYTNPFVCQWWAFDHDDRAYLYREIYYAGRLVEDHAKDIVRLSEGENIEKTVADWDAEDRATLERHGVYTAQAYKDISVGVQTTMARFKAAGDGKPRIFFMRDAVVEKDPGLVEAKRPTCTLDEISGYVWSKGLDGRPVKEVPVKVDDHGMDAMRYAMMGIERAAMLYTFADNGPVAEESMQALRQVVPDILPVSKEDEYQRWRETWLVGVRA